MLQTYVSETVLLQCGFAMPIMRSFVRTTSCVQESHVLLPVSARVGDLIFAKRVVTILRFGNSLRVVAYESEYCLKITTTFIMDF